MTENSRAFVALMSGELAMQRKAGSIRGRDNGRDYTFGERGSVAPTVPERACGVARDAAAVNYCLRDPESRSHICLSLYGRLFEGFDHGSASHFNGAIEGPEITLYDFGESDYFTYTLAS